MSHVSSPETCDSATPAASRDLAPDRGQAGLRTAAPLARVFGLFAAVTLLYWPSALELHRLWTDWSGETYTHGYLVLLLSIWLIIRDRERIALTPIRPQPLALIGLVVLSAAWVLFWRAAIQELQLLLLPLILYAAVFAALGRRMARRMAFPIAFLGFALPFWGDINGLVQGLSAIVTGWLVALTGIPAYLGGNVVHLPGGAIEIARSCSGLHALIVGLALSTFYGKVSDEPWRRRLLWIAVMGVLSLIVNWVRIFTVVVAAYETDMRSSLVEHHYWLGWWLFAFAFAGFLWWTGRSPAPPHGVARRSDDPGVHPARPRRIGAAPLIATVAVLAALPLLAYGMDWTQAQAAGAVLQIEWPAAVAGWTGPSTATAGVWQPHFVHASGESLTRYTDPAGQPLEAFAVAYRVQTQQAKLLGYWNHLLGTKAALRQQSARVVASSSGRWQEITAIAPDGSRSLLWTRYRIGSRRFVAPRLSQLWYGLVAIVKPPVSSLTALRAPCAADCSGARKRLAAAAAWLRPALR